MNKNKRLIIIAVVLLTLIISSVSIHANALDEVSPETLAVVLVIDNSGSMKNTDPERLRETAANIFIDLLSPEDYLGIITFNTKQKVVLPMQQIKSSDNKSNFKNVLSQSIDDKGDTDYLGAFNEASNQLSIVNKGNVRKVILFLTDGEPYPNKSTVNNSEKMNPYMESLWESVSNLALNKYSVYSVGFSNGIDTKVLERISHDTQGTIKMSDDSRELALNFFNILGTLKNRKEYLNDTFQLTGNKSIDFNLDEYTTQAAMVFTNPDGKPFDIKVTDPNGKNDGVTINKYDKYCIVTINKENEKLTGKWQVNLKGSGNITAFGSKDLFIKSWQVSPEPNSLHPLNEPLEISANLTGEIKEGVTAEAIITKEGVQDKTPVILTLKDGVFTGTYKNVNKPGNYSIDIRLILSGKIISENSAAFTVRELPSIHTDFPEKDSIYKLGDSFIVTSTLDMKGSKLINGENIKIENYNLLLNYTNSGLETISLIDNGSANNQDVKENDGVWSNKVTFNKTDVGKASIIVNGAYKGEKFLLEKPLGSFNVYAPGKILIKPLQTTLYTTIDGQLEIPIEAENTSNLTETILISIDKSIGKSAHCSFRIEPLKKINTNIFVNLNKNLEKKSYNAAVKITAEDNKSEIEPGEFTVNVQVLTKSGYLLRYLKERLFPLLKILLLILGIVLLIILLGLLLYRLLVYKNTIIQGKLLYYKESGTGVKEQNEFNLNLPGKGEIIISFNPDNNHADFHILDTEYDYDMKLSLISVKIRWKFVYGYKALFHSFNSSGVLLKTTEPGIFTYEGKVYTSKKIYKNDRFITGGYVFQYEVSSREKSVDKGKNVLLGREG